jgi:hypothetical protein
LFLKQQFASAAEFAEYAEPKHAEPKHAEPKHAQSEFSEPEFPQFSAAQFTTTQWFAESALVFQFAASQRLAQWIQRTEHAGRQYASAGWTEFRPTAPGIPTPGFTNATRKPG